MRQHRDTERGRLLPLSDRCTGYSEPATDLRHIGFGGKQRVHSDQIFSVAHIKLTLREYCEMYSSPFHMSNSYVGDIARDGVYNCPMSMSQRIKRARQNADLTQDQLADRIKRTRAAISQWENTDTQPRGNALELIAEATGVDVQWLKTGVELVAEYPDTGPTSDDIELMKQATQEADRLIAIYGKPVTRNHRFMLIEHQLKQLTELDKKRLLKRET